MRKYIISLMSLALLVSCAAQDPLSLKVVRSEMARCQDATYLDGLEGKLKWNYTTGLELKSFVDVYAVAPDSRKDILDYADAWYDAIIDSTGIIYKYKKSNFSTDHICPGRTLFQLYDLTGKAKYKVAMDSLYSQILDQPRTQEGGFWHKKIYPDQMWLDGLYMAQPFYAEYTRRYVEDPAQKEKNYQDIANHFITVYQYTFDPATGLLRHAWDSSHQMFWCNPETGQSAHAWGRAMGWYMMALADVIEILPSGNDKAALSGLFIRLWQVLPQYADPETGLWYQVLDQPGREGNYLEATCNAMFAYSRLKGVRLGLLDDLDAAKATYNQMLKTFVTESEDGLVTLRDCCEVAGLGGKDNRSGDYDYYIHERIRDNDPKGIGPLIWAALEYEKIK